MTAQDKEFVVVGRLSGVYGVRGWVKVTSYTQPRENILSYRRWHIRRQDQWQPIEFTEGHPQGKGLVAHLKGVDDRDMARNYIGLDVAVPRADLPPLPEGEFYWSDLQGLQVSTVEGVALGAVDYLLETGANDVLVVKDGERERLIPFLPEQVIKRVDLEAGTMTVDWDPDF
jgi:16S rRNA processing protein RimM